MSTGTVTVRRPRVRGLKERFESRVLPQDRSRLVADEVALVSAGIHDVLTAASALGEGVREE